MHIFVVKSKTLILAAIMSVVVILLAVSFGSVSSAAVYFNQTTRQVPIYGVSTEEKKIALTLDAAWGADKTMQILQVLESFDVTATFFLVGFWVDEYPEMVQAIYDAGCEIGTHSNTHPDMTKLSAEAVKQELESSSEKIKAITGEEVKVFRAPFGSYDNQLLDIASSMDMKTIQWTIDTHDWMGLSASEISGRVMSRAANGSIILAHNDSDHIVEAITLFVNRLLVEGYEFVTVSDLVYQEDFKIDHAGIQHKI